MVSVKTHKSFLKIPYRHCSRFSPIWFEGKGFSPSLSQHSHKEWIPKNNFGGFPHLWHSTWAEEGRVNLSHAFQALQSQGEIWEASAVPSRCLPLLRAVLNLQQKYSLHFSGSSCPQNPACWLQPACSLFPDRWEVLIPPGCLVLNSCLGTFPEVNRNVGLIYTRSW